MRTNLVKNIQSMLLPYTPVWFEPSLQFSEIDKSSTQGQLPRGISKFFSKEGKSCWKHDSTKYMAHGLSRSVHDIRFIIKVINNLFMLWNIYTTCLLILVIWVTSLTKQIETPRSSNFLPQLFLNQVNIPLVFCYCSKIQNQSTSFPVLSDALKAAQLSAILSVSDINWSIPDEKFKISSVFPYIFNIKTWGFRFG